MDQHKQTRLLLLERQVQRLRRRIQILDQRSNSYSWIRVFLFFGGLALAVIGAIAFGWWLGVIVLVLTLIPFAILASYHTRIDRGLARHNVLLHVTQAHIARIKLDWNAIPAAYADGAREAHPFENDLDITGSHSLHRLVNTAVSREGSLRLANWLLATSPDLPTLQQRQALVSELAPLTRFRDRLLVNSLVAGKHMDEQLDGKRLLTWLSRQSTSKWIPLLLIVSALINLLTLVLLVGTLVLNLPPLWIYSLAAGVLLFFATGEVRGDIFEDANYLRFAFSTLGRIFTFLETYPYRHHSHLKALCTPFFSDRTYSPSKLLQRTSRISSAATLKNNGMLWLVVNAFVPWDLYYSYRLGQYKTHLADHLPSWLQSWFELEAHCSLATFAYLNPEYTMPDVHAHTQNNQLFAARALGHPLLSADKKIINDFALERIGEVILITGSNMSGKSTFLRTLGVNLCLAYAGGPVNATSLHTDLFRLFTCIRVSDSVTEGYSYFYAEVRRLKALLQALDEPERYPLFYLIDEIFKGTNNRERLIGSRSFVRAVAGKNCVGAISTHDLELVKLADRLPDVLNYHFREEVANGEMIFDYKLRSGPSPTTNAVTIMRMEGLPIDEDDEEIQ